jgi:dTDP-4-amino-4,6-dideoxygalactose transaminase
MPVPLLDLKRQYAPLRNEIRAVLDEVCDSQRFILGPEVEAFEADALLAALMALGVGPGDEVVVPTFTFFATAGVVTRLGARPVLVDIDPVDYCLDPALLGDQITPCTRAIVPVHLFGQSANLRAILEAAGEVPVIEDCAQSWGASFDGQATGTLGLMGAFSFFPSKNLGCFGDGGLVTTNDPETTRLLKELRMHGQSGPYLHPRVGANFRLDALQAAVLRVKLRHVTGWIEGRRRNASRYAELFRDAGLAGVVRLPEAVKGRGHTFNQYVVRVPRRDDLRAFLGERGIGNAVYYPLPLHLQPCFAELGYHEGDMPVAERASREVLALPVFGELADSELEEVVATIKAFYER